MNSPSRRLLSDGEAARDMLPNVDGDGVTRVMRVMVRVMMRRIDGRVFEDAFEPARKGRNRNMGKTERAQGTKRVVDSHLRGFLMK